MARTRKIFTRAKIILDLEQTLNVRVAAESGLDVPASGVVRAVIGVARIVNGIVWAVSGITAVRALSGAMAVLPATAFRVSGCFCRNGILYCDKH